MTTVVTRFAPSPTGFLHIGGARTALFNWLYARRFGGTFLLRIEDTDRERSTKAGGRRHHRRPQPGSALTGTARRSASSSAQRAIAKSPRACSPRAPPIAATPRRKSFEQMRERSSALEGKPMRYDGRWRDRDPSEAPAGVAPVIRLRAPQDGETIVDDKVQGKVTFANKDLDDLVLLRSDGTPTYMLAVVVDDHDMGVTHIIRGDDHLTNAARQMQIYQALGWDVPVMAHIPLIHGPDGAKLSKRHGALGVDAYRAMGYLPAALRNYLVRLGWSQGDREFFSTEEMIAAFDLPAIGRSPSRFDFAKLEEHQRPFHARDAGRANSDQALIDTPALSARRARNRRQARRADARQARRGDAGPQGAGQDTGRAPRRRGFPVRRTARSPSTNGAREILANGGRAHLAALLPRLRAVTDWTSAATEAAVRDYALEHGAKLGQIAQPLRAATTGRATSPGIFDVLAVLGREESLGRLADQANGGLSGSFWAFGGRFRSVSFNSVSTSHYSGNCARARADRRMKSASAQKSALALIFLLPSLPLMCFPKSRSAAAPKPPPQFSSELQPEQSDVETDEHRLGGAAGLAQPLGRSRASRHYGARSSASVRGYHGMVVAAARGRRTGGRSRLLEPALLRAAHDAAHVRRAWSRRSSSPSPTRRWRPKAGAPKWC